MSSIIATKNPAIVVVAYNRPESLKRLLTSIGQSDFGQHENVQLIISLDNGENHKVLEVAELFVWRHGNKRIIAHPKRLGLRNHVLSCGDLALEYGSVIVLEDDLFVSPEFYIYAANALDSYESDELIGGVSLYSYRYVDAIGFLFVPSIVNGDVYFVKFPSSSGQAWSERQWQRFRNWLDTGRDDDCAEIDRVLPASVAAWPSSSWKKSFARYLVDNDMYVAYPGVSLTTNMGEAGQHWSAETSLHQVSIQGGARDFVFVNLMDAVSYDQFFELESRSLKILKCLGTLPSSVEFDLYGQKTMAMLENKMVVSSKQTLARLKSFGMQLLPHELNIAYEIPGIDFHFGEAADFLPEKNYSRAMLLRYHASFLGGLDLVKLLAGRISTRLIAKKT